MFGKTQGQKRVDDKNAIIRRKLDTINLLLDDYGEIVSFFKYFNPQKKPYEQDVDANRDFREQGWEINVSYIDLGSDLDVEDSYIQSEGRNLKEMITLKKIQINKKRNQVMDLIYELDNSGLLVEDFSELDKMSINDLEEHLKGHNFDNFGKFIPSIEKANSKRREIRSKLNTIWENTLNKPKNWNPFKRK